MFQFSLNNEQFRKYINILGIQQKVPSLDYLKEMVTAHLTKIPFENVSKIYYHKTSGLRGLLDLDLYLEGIEKYNFGGTCYANNYYLYLLLKYIGYDVKLCGADMKNPDVHIVSVVKLGEKEYIVDCGFGAPFTEPMPRDLEQDYILEKVGVKYVIKPQDGKHFSRLVIYQNGDAKEGYIVKPEPRTISYFEQVINRSFDKEAVFLNALLLARFFPDSSIIIRNMKLSECRGTNVRTYDIKSRGQLAYLITEKFNIPGQIVKPVLEELPHLRDVWD